MDRIIVTTTARLDDETEMAEFLSRIPDGDQLAKVLERREPVSTRAYEDNARIARFVESDGNVVMCFSVSDLTMSWWVLLLGLALMLLDFGRGAGQKFSLAAFSKTKMARP